MNLNADNYYTPEADREYMSCSQYQAFLSCEAAAMAKLYGLYTPKESEALLVGNYVHTALESDEAHEAFCESHTFDIYTTKVSKVTGDVTITGKRAAFAKADDIIHIYQTDPTFQKILLMEGENEKIMTGTLFGLQWKIRLDKYIPESRMIIDYKTSADLTQTAWNPEAGEKECFLETLGYLMRAAIYSEIEKQNTGSSEDPPFVILAVSKQDPPDRGAYLLNHRQRYDYELQIVEEKIKRIKEVRRGFVKPRRCGHCEWCRRTKKITKIVPYYTIKPGFTDPKEEEYDDIFATYMEDAQASREL